MNIDPENSQFLMETSLPTPFLARVYVNLPEGKIMGLFRFPIFLLRRNRGFRGGWALARDPGHYHRAAHRRWRGVPSSFRAAGGPQFEIHGGLVTKTWLDTP